MALFNVFVYSLGLESFKPALSECPAFDGFGIYDVPDKSSADLGDLIADHVCGDLAGNVYMDRIRVFEYLNDLAGMLVKAHVLLVLKASRVLFSQTDIYRLAVLPELYHVYSALPTALACEQFILQGVFLLHKIQLFFD